MSSNNSTLSRQHAVPNIAPYPTASRVSSRHGSSVTEAGHRKIYARNTFLTSDPQEKVMQYYSEQFGQPVQQSGSACWQQETHSGSQHITIQLSIEMAQSGQAPSQNPPTLIKSYCMVTVAKQAG